MKKALVTFLLLSGLLTSLIVFPVEGPITLSEQKPNIDAFAFIDEDETASVSLRFTNELSSGDISRFESLGIDFGDLLQHVDNIYLAEVSRDAMLSLIEDPLYVHVEPQREYNYIPTRDVSVQETYADVTWDMLDIYGENVTGEGILIADLDTGIQWRHPDFFFADGGSYTIFDAVGGPPYLFQNGTDGIDTNSNFALESTELLYALDIDNNGTFEVDTDWLWMDNGATVGSIDDGDTFFVVDDQDGDGLLSVGEPILKLDTPKTKYIVHKPGSSIQVWDRDDAINNLDACTFYDTDGHGTGVAGILNGGQLGYRKYVGIAPGAELMAINVFGSDGLTVEEGLIWAQDHGADVIIIELGSWTYQFLDGSSNVELMIDALTASGIPVIVPAGNLRLNMRHVARMVPNSKTITRFNVSGYEPTEVYLTLLSDKIVDTVQVNITEPTSDGSIVHQLTMGSGYWNWGPSLTTANLTIDAFIANSTRGGIHMIAIDISAAPGKVLWGNFSLWSVDILDPLRTAFYHFYLSDDISGWGGGAEWFGPDGVHDGWTITWPSTADTAISVASYMSRNIWSPGYGFDAPYSSIGSRIDGQGKMSISAPGGWDIVSPWSSDSSWSYWYDGTTGGYTLPLDPEFGSYHLFSGTSAAGPHVAGAAALMLQVNPDCGSKVKDIIENTAWHDGITGAIPPPPNAPNIVFGYGKLNISAAIEMTELIPYVHDISMNPNVPEYSDAVSITVNVSNADYVVFNWTNDDWSTFAASNMTLSSGLYTTTIPTNQYGLSIDYSVTPASLSIFYNLTYDDGYEVGDFSDPLIGLISSNITGSVDGTKYSIIQVNATVSEDLNASGIDAVYLWMTSDDWDTQIGYQMVLVGGVYVAESPIGVGDMKYHIIAEDNADNTAESIDYSYTVTGVDPTDTTTDTTSTDTGINTSTNTTTGDLPLPDFLLDNLQIIAVAGVVLIVVICLATRKRK